MGEWHQRAKNISLEQCMRACALVVVAALILLVVHPTALFAAGYTFSPATGSYQQGAQFSVRLMINPSGTPVNSGEATIRFDASKLAVSSISTNGSPFTIWTPPTPDGPTYSNSQGTITFSGGGLSTIASAKAVITISFTGKAQGDALVSVSSGKLLAADGKGTNVFTPGGSATYTITEAASVAPTQQPTKHAVNIPKPDPPTIKSSTHPDQEAWSNATTSKFSWDIPYGVTAVRFGFGTSTDVAETTEHEPPIGEFTAAGIADGVWYFKASYENRGGWSSSTVYKLMIDTVPPEPFEVTTVGGDLSAQLRFDAFDTRSGIEVYQLAIDDGRTRDIRPDELSGDGYTLSNIDPGNHTLTLSAIDKAGNVRSVDAEVVVTGELPPEESDVAERTVFGAVYWLSLIFIAVITILISMLLHERKKAREEKDRIKREAMEAGEKLINIFGVLREEIEEKVLELSHKPNMTDNERNILEALKDALDISEELIDKEIEDVRKLLK